MNKKIAGLALTAMLVLTMTVLPNVAAQDDALPATEGRPLLGVAYTTNDDGFPQIARVDEGTPAADAGLMADDVITAVDGDSVEGEDLAEIIGAYAPGDTITVTVTRDGEEMDFEVTLAEFAPMPSTRPGVRMQVLANTFLGISVEAGEDGLTILDVAEDSPAEEAGLQEGDIVVAFNGEDVADVAALRAAIRAMSPGDTVTVTVLRDGEEMDLDVTLAERSAGTDLFRFERPNIQMQLSAVPFVGVGLEMTDDGIVVTEVVPDSPAEEAGLQEGDVIVSLNGEEAIDRETLIEAIRQFAAGESVTLGIQRDSEQLEIEITLGDWPGTILRGDFGDSLRSDNDIQYLADEGVWEVNALDEDSALAEAGLQAGDRITALNGESLELDFDESHGLMHAFALGGEATLTVERGGETLEIEVPAAALMELMMGAMHGVMPLRDMMQGVMPLRRFGEAIQVVPQRVVPQAQEVRPQVVPRNRPVWLGVRYLMLNEQIAEARDLSVSEGALLLEIEPLSPAEVAGLQVGDIIVAIDGDALDTSRVLARRLNAYAPGDTLTLDVLRSAESLQIEVTLDPVPQSG
jgi:S1-C subfamily serine protease